MTVVIEHFITHDAINNTTDPVKIFYLLKKSNKKRDEDLFNTISTNIWVLFITLLQVGFINILCT